MGLALLATATVFAWWLYARQKESAADAHVERTQSLGTLEQAQKAVDDWLRAHPGGIDLSQQGAPNKAMFEQSMFEVPDISGATIQKGFPRIMKVMPKSHWWTSRFQTGTSSSVVFQNDDDLISMGTFPKGSIVAYLGITTEAGCDQSGDICQFQRSFVSGSRTDGTVLVGWVESSDLVEV